MIKLLLMIILKGYIMLLQLQAQAERHNPTSWLSKYDY